MSSCRYLTPEGVLATVSRWEVTPFVYTSPQLESITPVAGAPTEMGVKQCTVWAALREIKTADHVSMSRITPHCMHDVTTQEFEKMKNVIDTDRCVQHLWHELENSRETKRQKKK